ncbi:MULTISPECIES: lysophospholipid acyltransferase family protein [unclassified Undibacterium]|uniref:lysophospholipid acyltransferase family protein n=1 Tax=unclassified Undibacterium TaxID=2630295 RepID=UPI002AC8EE78|nr:MULTISPECIES: lysophospholipid acyltransferase family protein [unclassified Undibacterium]MEB0139270.1 lysophospholipid acyltransferase family protein [Undibacterium sp. CCC2.1]MEB0172114.1 lysophospholipid acyltransferase family protein [Undibacterium sp. CCC1.1]MEB0175989.1 lysophospholipid acyltransferase family protein [Undibacterium sp. CCC3.4]MEB0215301.1 lysophospholipid acyltransferase family protein [Undibacterium sp. 5I2]WPX45475.1 lysophospholipid acyltransferase family protein [
MLRFTRLLRSMLFLLLMIVATVIWAPISMLFAFLPYNQRYYITARWNVFIIWCARVVCGIRYEFKGFENFPDAPAIILSKHQSAWETIFLLMATPRPLVFVFKKEITYIPFFGWAISMLRMIPIDRSKGKDAFAQVVTHGKKRLADGQWIIMFPEGTRIAVGKKGNYKGGGARLAVETNTPVVPIALNSGECWPKNSFIKKPGLVTVSVGAPIYPGNSTPVELMQQVEAWIEAEMRVISPQVYRDK